MRLPSQLRHEFHGVAVQGEAPALQARGGPRGDRQQVQRPGRHNFATKSKVSRSDGKCSFCRLKGGLTANASKGGSSPGSSSGGVGAPSKQSVCIVRARSRRCKTLSTDAGFTT
mmetsp:Transcript_126891/g.353333  ORF Transcript_126891/g.353333 Transcript_126891/m.353333 type:complete len:114 (-) Transcript_126891:1029-1370(-)